MKNCEITCPYPGWLSPHTLLPSPTGRIPSHQSTSCSQALDPSNRISIFQKESVWCTHLTWKFSAWMVRLKLCLKTGSSKVSDNLDRQCYQLCTQCSWLSSCHIQLDRVFPVSWMKLSCSNFQQSIIFRWFLMDLFTTMAFMISNAVIK